MVDRRQRTAGPGTEAGFTLVELLVATVIGLLVVGAGVAIFTSGVRSEPRISERSAQIQQARAMAERITRELRPGSNAQAVDPSQLMILTYLPRIECGDPGVGSMRRCRVFYSCDASGTCARTECGPNTFVPGGDDCGPWIQAVNGLADSEVFDFSPRLPGQAFVSVRLSFPADEDEDAITINDGVALRNPPLGGP